MSDDVGATLLQPSFVLALLVGVFQTSAFLVIAGRIEQWIDREKRMLGPGDCAFIPAGVVHASFNTSGEPVKLAAILGPCVGPAGYELVDVASEAPWKTLRK